MRTILKPPLILCILFVLSACDEQNKPAPAINSSPPIPAALPITTSIIQDKKDMNPILESMQTGGIWIGLGIAGTTIGLIAGTILGSRALEESKRKKKEEK